MSHCHGAREMLKERKQWGKEGELRGKELKHGERCKTVKSERGDIALNSLWKKSTIKEEMALEKSGKLFDKQKGNVNTKEK